MNVIRTITTATATITIIITTITTPTIAAIGEHLLMTYTIINFGHT